MLNLLPIPFTLFLVTACTRSTPDMRQELADLVRQGTPDMYYHWNAARAGMYLTQADTASTDASRLKLTFLYWTELLNAGQTQECIDQINAYIKEMGTDVNALLANGSKPIVDLLAVAYLRLGEQQNCQANHSPLSCIVPFRESALHQLPAGSEHAITLYDTILDQYPNDLQSLWLFNVAHMTLGHDMASIPETRRIIYPNWDREQKNFPMFHDVAMSTGADIVGLSGGACVDDFNNDGYLDIFATSYGMQDQVRLLINDQQGGFSDQTERSGLTGIVSGLNAMQADYDNDGDRDIFITRGGWLIEHGQHPNSLLRNNGDGTFEDVTFSAGLTSRYPTQTAAWGDFNNDGWLDLFVGNESNKEHPVLCELYQNNHDGTFTEVARTAGINVSGIVKGVAWGDINNDGWIDLYVSCLGGSNKLFRNDKGHFTDISRTARVQGPNFSFPCWFWDFNNDGLEDILVASYDMRAYTQVGAAFCSELKTGRAFGDMLALYQNNGDETFTDVAEAMGLHREMHAMGSNFGDLDNDGYPDFYIGTGAPNFMSITPNRMFHNVGGNKFEEVTSAGGFGHLQKGHAIAFGDLDNDGDQDIYEVMGGAYEGDTFNNTLFENPGTTNQWISLDLQGVQSNRDAIGARLALEVEDDKGIVDTLYASVSTGGSFGASSLRQELGLGAAQVIRQLTITWPSGSRDTYRNIQPGQFLTIKEGDAIPHPKELRAIPFSHKMMEGHHPANP